MTSQTAPQFTKLTVRALNGDEVVLSLDLVSHRGPLAPENTTPDLRVLVFAIQDYLLRTADLP